MRVGERGEGAQLFEGRFGVAKLEFLDSDLFPADEVPGRVHLSEAAFPQFVTLLVQTEQLRALEAVCAEPRLPVSEQNSRSPLLRRYSYSANNSWPRPLNSLRLRPGIPKFRALESLTRVQFSSLSSTPASRLTL